ncbi:MAG: helix-turn-helix transcriptional regulator [Clostridiales bacterium]|jgi:transcriptional regulator with XRE-family HTH domain|nr:helix-turn-helix transcriptional regulator [Clostridiales bacterium]
MENRLRQLRKEKSLNQSDIAEMLGVSSSTYSYWELGRFDIELKSLIWLADFFNVSIDYILKRKVLYNEDAVHFQMFVDALREHNVEPQDIAKLSAEQVALISGTIKNFI